ncbi:MAG: hypothetical protein ABI863_11100 [Ginsengibacter sp.]
MSFKKISFFLLLLCFSLVSNAQTVDEIITRYIAFTGGNDRWKTIKTMVISGTYNYGGMEFPFISYSKAPDLYKYIVGGNGKHFAQAFDGKKGWKIDEFKNETKEIILTGRPALAMANEADVELESPFINYQNKGCQAIKEGKDTIDGKACFKVVFIRNKADTETYFFNMNDFELVKKQAVSKNAELDNSMLETFYSNYQTVQGLKMPFKSVSKIKEQTILTITIKKVELNIPIQDSIFKP